MTSKLDMPRGGTSSSSMVRAALPLVAAMVAGVIALGLAVPPGASAAPKAVFDAFGSVGAGQGQFAADAPQGVAVNQMTGDVFVVDSGNHRVQRLTGGGAFASQVGSGASGTLGGLFNTPRGVDVNQADGSVFVTDGGNRRVQKFSASLGFGHAWGFNVDIAAPTDFEVCSDAASCQIGATGAGDGQFASTLIGNPAFDAVSGSVYVADTGNRRVQRFNATTAAFEGKFGVSGSAAGQFGSNSPSRVAVDSVGAIYAVDFGNVRVQKCVPTGTPPAVTATCTNFYAPPTPNANIKPVAVAVNTGIASNPGNGNVLIARRNGTGTATTGEVVVDEYTPAGTLVDTHALGAGIAAGVSDANGRDRIGIAVRTGPSGTTDRVYVTNGGGSGAIGSKLYVLDQVIAPTATLNTPSGVTADQATLSGTVNPNGSQTNWRFEYTTDGTTWKPVQSDQSAGGGNTPVSVTQTLTGLTGGQAHQVRLVTTKPFGAPSTTTTPIAFTTAAAAPTIVNGTATFVNSSRAVLNATINPNNEATSYRFEYGTTTAYGHSAPVPDGTLLPDNKPLKVTQKVLGLEAGVTYHYRIVATNANGTTGSSDRTFATPTDLPTPPEGRAYELVSEAKGEAIDVVPSPGVPGGSQISSDGDALLHGLSGAPPDGQGGPVVHMVVARRNSALSRWDMTSLVPPVLPNVSTLDAMGRASFGSDDLSKTVVFTNAALTADAWPGSFTQATFYLRDTSTGALRLLTPAAYCADDPCVTPGYSPGYTANVHGGSADLDQLLIETTAALTPDAAPPALPANSVKLYKWDDGSVTLQSVLPGGVPTAGSAAGPVASVSNPGATTDRVTGALSIDGSAVYFSASPSGNPDPSTARIYRREDAETVLVNSEENDNEDVPSGPAIYWMAVRDGSKVLFSSTQHLVEEDTNATAAAGADLYMYTHSGDPTADENLTLLSLPVAPGGTTGVQGVLGADEDGTRVYFVASGQLTPDAPADGANKAYLWQRGDITDSGDPELRYIGTVGTSNQSAWTFAGGAGGQVIGYSWRSVSADGSGLLLATAAALDPEHPDTGGLQQVYRYGVTEDEFTCVSCPDVGVPSAAARIRYWDGATMPPVELRGVEPRWGISADGRTVMFESRDALVPEDVNGQTDTYIWRNGELQLISTGRSEYPSTAVDLSSSGDNVYFTTADQLVARDHDDSLDVYVARIDGGFFDDPPPPPVICAALSGGCQGDGAEQVAVRRGTESPSSNGNANSRARRGLTVGAISSKARRLATRRGVLTLRVRTDRAGRVAAVARARFGSRVRRVARGSIRLPGAGSGVLRLRLDGAVRRRLGRGRAVSVSVRVTSAGARPRTIAVRLPGVKP